MWDQIERKWAPPDDPVFQLTPRSFHEQASAYYAAMDAPAVCRGTFWKIYSELLSCFHVADDIPNLEQEFYLANLVAEEEVELEEEHRPLRQGDNLVGHTDVPFDIVDYADFTDEEMSDDSADHSN